MKAAAWAASGYQKDLPGANVKSGLSVTGSEASNAAGRVKKWLAANGLA